MNKKFLIIAILALVVVTGYAGVVKGALTSSASSNVLMDDNYRAAKDGASCATTVVAAAQIGNQQSLTILATSSNRAYVQIKRVTDGAGVATTGPVFLSFSQGAAAVANAGLELSTTSPVIEFGRATNFPYVGTVTGRTALGSTTILVTACDY